MTHRINLHKPTQHRIIAPGIGMVQVQPGLVVFLVSRKFIVIIRVGTVAAPSRHGQAERAVIVVAHYVAIAIYRCTYRAQVVLQKIPALGTIKVPDNLTARRNVSKHGPTSAIGAREASEYQIFYGFGSTGGLCIMPHL